MRPQFQHQQFDDPATRALRSALKAQTNQARTGAELVLAERGEAKHWSKLEAMVEQLKPIMRPLAEPTFTNAVAAALAQQPDGWQRAQAFQHLVTQHHDWFVLWQDQLPEAERHDLLGASLIWVALWHLLAADVPLGEVGRVLVGLMRRHQAGAPVQEAVPSVTARAGAGLMSLTASAGKFVQEAAISLQQHRQQRKAEEALAKARREAEESARKAATDARRQAFGDNVSLALQQDAGNRRHRAPERPQRAQQVTRQERASATVPLAINGPALHGSVFGTWLLLVCLSWVSLFWGALISAPIGVGLGIMATAFAGVFVVPMWATFWGFVGMQRAHDRSLTDLGFEDVAADTGLATATADYAAKLGLPPPRIGTVPVHNAFAMGLDRQHATVAIGLPLIDKLTDAEVRAVIGHELGHIASGDMRRMMLMKTFQNATVWFGLLQGVKQFARWVICWAAELMILRFSRKREYWADAVGAALAGTDAMIGALRKLEAAPPLTDAENTHARFMFRGRIHSALSTHPSTAQRIAALEAGIYVRRLPQVR